MLRKLGSTSLLAAFVLAIASAATADPPPSDPPAPDAPLLCCDGTRSPTCTCAGPRRGCCSHHKGVCGCASE